MGITCELGVNSVAVGAMDAAHAELINLEGDRVLFPSDLAYYDRRVVSRSPLWWCGSGFWAWCKNRGSRYAFKNWRKQITKLLIDASLSDQCRWRNPDTLSSAIAPICTTACLIGVLMLMIHQLHLRSAGLRTAIVHNLLDMSTRVVLHCPDAMQMLTLEAHQVRVSNNGVVTGFWQALETSCPHIHYYEHLRTAWQRIEFQHAHLGSFEQDEVSFRDIMLFLCFYNDYRSSRNMHKLSDRCTGWWLRIQLSVAKWLVAALEWYIHNVYAQYHDVTRPPNSLSLGGQKRKYTRLHPDVVWRLLEKQLSNTVSLRQVLQVMGGEPSAGCSPKNAYHWEYLLEGQTLCV